MTRGVGMDRSQLFSSKKWLVQKGFPPGRVMTRTEGISPWKSNKDAVSASCILPGRAPNHIFWQKYDAVESFYSLSRLGIFVFQKHCITKLWLQLLNDQTKLTNENRYLLVFWSDFAFFGKVQMKIYRTFLKEHALLHGSLERKPGWRFTARLTLHPSWSSAYPYYFTKIGCRWDFLLVKQVVNYYFSETLYNKASVRATKWSN